MSTKRNMHLCAIILVVMAIGIIALVFAAGGAKAATITVDDSGGKMYTTIQAGVNAASAGDTVYVYNGTYNEQITISTSSINLVGESNQSTIIQGSGVINSKGIYVLGANYVHISNFKIDNFFWGIGLYSSSNNNISSNIITTGSAGISIYWYSNNNNIISNTITNYGNHGVCFYASDNNIITSNNIYGNGEYGLRLTSGSSNTAYNNWWGDASGPYNAASNPTGTGNAISDGVPFSSWLMHPFDKPVRNNNTNTYYSKIQDAIDAASAGDAVYVYNGTYNEQVAINKTISLVGESNQSTIIQGSGVTNSISINVSANYVNISNLNFNNSYYGIYLTNITNNTITSNVFASCKWYEIYLKTSSNNTITSNTITKYGIYVNGGSNNTITSNTIMNSCDSVYLSSSSNNNVSFNTIINSSNGIHLYSSVNNTITNNMITNDSYVSIFLDSSSNNTLASNTISYMTNSVGYGYGICLESNSKNNIITSNTITNCSDGIYFSLNSGSNCNYNTIASNTITNCSSYGIFLFYDSNYNNIISNTVSNCSQDGIYLWGSNCSIGSNTISNTIRGIQMGGGSTNNITSNTISNCSQGIYIQTSNNNVINNTITNSNPSVGITIGSGSYNNITNNTFLNGGFSIVNIHSSTQVMETNMPQNNTNTVNGKPVVSIKNINSSAAPTIIEGAGQVLLYNTSGFIMRNNSFNAPLYVVNSNNITITSNTIANCSAAPNINFYHTSDSNIISNNITNSSSGTIFFYNSSNNTVLSNTFLNCGYGISLDSTSNNNIVTSNTISNCNQGIYIQTSNNTITNTTITNSTNYDFYFSLSGAATVATINTTFNASKVYCSANSKLTVQNYLDVSVKYASNATPIQNANVVVKDNGTTVYSSLTGADGKASWILVTDRVYAGSNTATRNITTVSVTKTGLAFLSRDVNMSTSHTENFTTYENIRNNDTGYYYATIQDAINASTAGDTIYVKNGTYYVNWTSGITISKSITLIGESNQNTIIKGSGVSNSIGVYVIANYVNISNLKIDNFYYGIYLDYRYSTTTIIGNTVTNCNKGIFPCGANNNITGNTIANCSNGIYLYSTSSNNNNITGNTIANCSHGIYLEYSSNNNTITGNTVANCSSRSIYLWHSPNNTLTGNTVTNCVIYLYYSSNNNITGNTVANCSEGIYLHYSSNNNITGNTVTNCTGIVLTSSSNNNITGNTVANCNSIYIYSSSNNNIVTSNNIYDNRQYGLYRSEGSGNTAYNNWWGDASGPYNAASNPSGTGNNITDGVPFSPWAIWPFPANLPETPSITTLQYTDTDGSYFVNWTASNYVTNYILEENSVVIFNNTNTSLTYAFAGKLDGTYTYRVRAWNVNGTSGWSSPITIIVDNAKPPGAPSITTTPCTDTDSNYFVSWTAANYVTNYVLEENSVVIFNNTNTSCTYTFAGKPDGTYTYRVQAWNVNGTSSWSTAVTIIVDIAKMPGVPSITTAAYIDTDGSYSINWTSSAYAAKYVLEENSIEVYNGTALTYLITGRADGTYTYRVKAWNTNGTSSWSSSVTITVDNAKLPGTPSITTSSYTDEDGNYSVNWTTSTYTSKYILEEGGVGIYNGTALTYSFTSKSDGSYAYRIRAWNINGTSSWSSAVTVMVGILRFPGTPPITTTQYTDTVGSYIVNWSSSVYADKYALEENGVEVYNGTALTYSFTGKADGSYTYKVKAWNTNGTSSWSSPITITVDVAKLPGTPPITTTSYTDTDGSYIINWTSSAYATKYILEENGAEIFSGSALTYSSTGKSDGAYTYRVKAWNINGTSSWSSSVTITVDNAKLPGIPALTTTAYTDTDGSYSINWTTSVYAAKYILEENGVNIYNGTELTCALSSKSDGTYTYKVRAWNINGTSSGSSPITITVDNIKVPGAPTITTSSYTDTDGNYSISWTTSIYTTKYVLDENGIETYNGTNLTYVFADKIDGAYAYKVKAWNANGTSPWSSSITITVDRAKLPETPSIITGSYTDTDGLYAIEWTSTAYAASYALNENGVEIYNGTNLNYSFTDKSDGSYIYIVIVWNLNGTSNSSLSVTITVDNAKLPADPSFITASSTDTDGAYTITWTTSAYAAKYILEENGTEIFSGEAINCSFTGKADGTYIYKVNAANINGTSNWSAPVTITVDNIKIPAAPTLTTTAYTDTDGSYNINWTSSAYAAKYIIEENGIEIYNTTDLTCAFADKSDGIYTYKVKAENNNGTSPWSSSATIIVDNAKLPGTPVITTSSYTDTDGTYSISWTASPYVTKYILEENNSEIYNGTNLTYAFTGKQNSMFSYRVKAWNANGTSAWSPSVYVLVPNQKPTIVISSPVLGAIVSGTVNITGTAADSDGTVTLIEVKIDNGQWLTANGTTNWYTWTTSTYTNGYHKISARAFDGELYSDDCSIIVYVYNPVPNQIPIVNISYPTPNTNVSGTVNINGTAYDIDGTIQRVDIKIENGTWQTANGTTTWYIAWNFTTVQNGVHTISVRSYDGTDYSNITTVNITVNNPIPNQKPTVVILKPANGTVVEGVITVSGTANDTDGTVYSVEVKVGDSSWYAASGTQTWNYSLNTTNLPSGNATISARAFDGTDYSPTAAIVIMINKAPIVTITSPANNAGVSGKTTVSGTASDSDGTVQTVEIRIDNGTWQAADLKKGEWKYTIDTATLANGEHKIYVRAYDGISNSTEKSITIKVDNKPPKKGGWFLPAPDTPIVIATVGLLAVAGAFFRRRKL